MRVFDTGLVTAIPNPLFLGDGKREREASFLHVYFSCGWKTTKEIGRALGGSAIEFGLQRPLSWIIAPTLGLRGHKGTISSAAYGIRTNLYTNIRCTCTVLRLTRVRNTTP
jgi:hypothetical protein